MNEHTSTAIERHWNLWLLGSSVYCLEAYRIHRLVVVVGARSVLDSICPLLDDSFLLWYLCVGEEIVEQRRYETGVVNIVEDSVSYRR